MVELNLKLKQAQGADFFRSRSDGTRDYLFGKLYFVKQAPKQWSVNVFRSTKLGKLHFKECFNAGIVYVVDNADDMGVINIH